MTKISLSRMRAPRDSASDFEQRRAAPHDAQERCKRLMQSLMAKKDLKADEYWAGEANAWVLPFWRSPILVQLVRIESEDEDTKAQIVKDFVLVYTRVMRLPSTQLLALYRYVLEANDSLQGVAFSIEADYLMLTSRRSLQDLDESELDALIGQTVVAAQHFGPLLGEQFDVGAVAA